LYVASYSFFPFLSRVFFREKLKGALLCAQHIAIVALTGAGVFLEARRKKGSGRVSGKNRGPGRILSRPVTVYTVRKEGNTMKLDERTKELIAVGASVTANCGRPCLEYHAAKAQESGATEEEIKEAIEVGKEVRKGASGSFDKFAYNLLKGTPDKAKTEDVECGRPS
jgi:AhpD family alkylhydroperoxidase